MPSDLSSLVVDTRWAADHLHDPAVRFVEADMTPEEYDSGHIPGAVFWNMPLDLMRPDFSVNLDPDAMGALLSRSGIGQETTVVCYGRFAAAGAWLFWLLRVFGHADVRVLDGGRQKWIAEGRAQETTRPNVTPTAYQVQPPDASLRAFLPEVQAAVHSSAHVLVDVRSPQEFCGEWYYSEPPKENERAGHIPGAVHIGFEATLQPDGAFRPLEELQALFASHGVTPDKEIFTYCTVGARSSHTWFVLKHLLGYPSVRNYDGSWHEWSRQIDAPIASE